MGPDAQWGGETVQVSIVDDRSPVTIQLKDANTSKDILSAAYSLQEIRIKSNGQDVQIRQNLGGPFVMARFEIAENNLERVNF
jgi:hypothetical protein